MNTVKKQKPSSQDGGLVEDAIDYNTLSSIVISNSEFVTGIFGSLDDDIVIAAHSCDDVAKSNWKPTFGSPSELPDRAALNTYYSPSSFKAIDGKYWRDIPHFNSLAVVVLDDVTPEVLKGLPDPTYALLSSKDNYQVGYKLAEPVTDIALAVNIHARLALADYCDKAGNNPVRWVRLPVGFNRNSNKGKAEAHELRVWQPDATYDADELCKLLELPKAEIVVRKIRDPQGNLHYLISDQTAAHLRHHLAGMDADDWDVWYKVCAALVHSGQIGADICHEWSSSSAKYSIDDTNAKMAEFAVDGESHYAAIFKMPSETPVNVVVRILPIAEALLLLQAMTKEEQLDGWVALALQLQPIDVTKFIDEIDRLTGIGKNPLNAVFKAAKKSAEVEKSNAAFKFKYKDAAMILFDQTQVSYMTEQVENALIQREEPSKFVLFGEELSMVATGIQESLHQIDNPDLPPPASLCVRRLGNEALVHKIEKHCVFYRESDDGITAHPVPPQVISHLKSKRDESSARKMTPKLAGIVNHPMIMRDGTIISELGYNRNQFFIGGDPVSDLRQYNVTEAAEALERLRHGDFLTGFEFASDLDRELAITGLFTTMTRRMLDQGPGLLINASMQSSGKTTLARRINVILTGLDLAVTSVSATEEELSKKLLALLLPNPEVICFDNFGDGLTFSSASLASVMTSTNYSERILGASETVTVPCNMTPILTGNNIKLGNDEISRWLNCQLSPATDKPETRTFSRPDVVEHGREMRETVLRDVIGIISGYLTSGDNVSLSPSSRFNRWDQMVVKPLVWAGGLNVNESFERNSAASESKQAVNTLITLLYEEFGDEMFTSADVVKFAQGGFAGINDYSSEGLKRIGDAVTASLESLKCRDVTKRRSVAHALNANLGKYVKIEGVGSRKMSETTVNKIRGWVLR